MTHPFTGGLLFASMPFLGFGILGIIGAFLGLLLVFAIIVLKGYALWFAAKRDEKWWFAALLLINTLGILELCYLVFVVKKWQYKITHEDTKTGQPEDHKL